MYWNTFMYILNNLVWDSAFSSVNFMQSKHRSSISDEILAPELRCAVCEKYTLGFKDFV